MLGWDTPQKHLHFIRHILVIWEVLVVLNSYLESPWRNKSRRMLSERDTAHTMVITISV